MSSKNIVICVEKQDGDQAFLDAARSGADYVLVYDHSATRDDIDKNDAWLKNIVTLIDTPVIIGGGIGRFEDVKKLLYAGAEKVVVDDTGNATYQTDSVEKIITESSDRFGSDNVLKLSDIFIIYSESFEELRKNVIDAFAVKDYAFISYRSIKDSDTVIKLKSDLKNAGIDTSVMISAIPFSQFKTDDKGLVPCIVQDYRTNEVLMMAYMNEESYNKTLETGLMTYWTRSRQKLWTKGEESGHFSFVRSLSIDCDKDTMLAKVYQVGPACHTGNQSCFYTSLAKRQGREVPDSSKVLEDVYATILDRKKNPREGSYTNYLFDKGIDKILKKVGEECTEIVIAAKNPDPEEIKYEIADFLYHAMVLMVEKGVTWDEIKDELARRE
ncbi:MAG: bifunctional phosphoribosyl-AMP cyclohydrolase/phosphoribosyl-ATP diphosphatase HisIE [Eubacterium sp.]|nr:bifunctional phosphoribosyl-AMP cyclohydrolase/phosphoribosyl-ATP diphosphatase HisIE [Eubacterium sp.]